MSSDWINLDLKEMKGVADIDLATGVSFFPSPYNLPAAMKVDQDKMGNFVVYFSYIDSGEPVETKPATHGHQVVLGKNSHRIFGVNLGNVREISSGEVAQMVAEVIRSARPEPKAGARDNVSATLKAVELNRNRLIHGPIRRGQAAER